MPMLQIDGIDIAQIDPTMASVLRHFVLRAGIGEGGGLPKVMTEPTWTEGSASHVWPSMMNATDARVTVALRFKDVSEREARSMSR